MYVLTGSLFLWLFWPSFNAALAGNVGNARHRAVINTILAIACSTFSSFMASRGFRKDHKFNMVDVQNATLAGLHVAERVFARSSIPWSAFAGGVAVGASANMMVGPWGALMIGATAGLVSTFGFSRMHEYINHKFGLLDTCGVHNLHGMPSVVGALASVLIAGKRSVADCKAWCGLGTETLLMLIRP
jgi:ammonium transporter Rh